MNLHRSILPLLLMTIALSLLSACGSSSTPESAPASATLLPTATRTPLPTATFTPLPTATRTPTRTPLPTATDRPRPTATPVGFYSHTKAGFSLAFPSTFSLLEEQDSSVYLMDDKTGMILGVLSDPYDPELTLELMAGYIIADYPILRQSDPYELALGAAGLKASALDTTVRTTSGSRVDIQVIYYENGKRFYCLTMFGEQGFQQKQAAYLEKVYSSFAVFPPSVFDLPRDRTLGLLGGDPTREDLDPQLTTGGIYSYAGLLFAGLVRLDQDMNILPDLAEDWTISADGTVYTFTLRTDLTFADGYYLTAEDVIYSWDRAADPETDSPTYNTYLGDIVGVAERHAGEADTIAGLRSVGERTLVVTLDAPKPYFLLKLTYPVAFVVDRRDVEKGGKDWMYSPNASGPYRVEEYVEMEKLVFSVNKRYHTPPAIPYIGYLLNPQGSPISRYEDDSLDIVGVGGETALRVRRAEDPLHAELHSVPGLCTTFIAMSNTLPPFDDPKVRQAFLLAFDRDIYNQRIDRGLNLPALSLLPPAMPGYLAENAVPAYDPEAAKAALAESRYAADMPEVVLETAGFGGEDDSLISALADMWRKTLGIDIRVVFLDPINYSEAALEYPAQLSASGWCADYPDPQNFFDPLFRTGAEFNEAGYTNPELDALLAQAGVEADPQRRLALYQQAEKLLLEDFALLPLVHGINEMLVKPRILGLVTSPLIDVNLYELSIDPNVP